MKYKKNKNFIIEDLLYKALKNNEVQLIHQVLVVVKATFQHRKKYIK